MNQQKKKGRSMEFKKTYNRAGVIKSKKLERKMSLIKIQPKDYKLIPLSKGKFAKVDNNDFEEISKHNWCFSSNNYAYNHSLGFMHRFIMNTPKHLDTDHINGDGIDNRRINLRTCTTIENCRNQRKRKNSSSKYKGVHFCKIMNKWKFSIKKDNKTSFYGYSETEEEAAKAYDKKAKELFGEFAYLNFK